MNNDNKNSNLSEGNENPISISSYGNMTEGLNQWEDYISCWTGLKEIDQAIQFTKGDLVDKLSIKFGEHSLAKFAAEIGEKEQTLIAYRRVARAFPLEKRNLNLTWFHYFIAAQTDEYDKGTGEFKSDKRFKWAEKANDENLSTTKLEREIKVEKMGFENDSAYDKHSRYLKTTRDILLHSKKEDFSPLEKLFMVQKIRRLSLDLQDHLGVSLSKDEESVFKSRQAFLAFAKVVLDNRSKFEGKADPANKNNPPKIDFTYNKKNGLFRPVISDEDMKRINWVRSVEIMLNEMTSVSEG